MKYYLLLLVSLVSLGAAGQTTRATSGYVVTAHGDTLRGQLLLLSEGGGALKLKQPGKDAVTFTPAEVRSYGDQAGVLATTQLLHAQGPAVFTSPLVLGTVSLFSYRSPTGQQRYGLLVPDSTHLLEINPTAIPLALHQNLTGCRELEFTSDAAQRRYTYTVSALSQLVLAYNACAHRQQPAQAVPVRRVLRYSFGLKAGLNTSHSVLFQEEYPLLHRQSLGYQAGLGLRITNRTRFSLLLEANVARLRSQYNGTHTYNYGGYQYARSVSVDYLQLPVLARYTAGLGKVRPFFDAGLLFAVSFRDHSTDQYLPTEAEASAVLNSLYLPTLKKKAAGACVGLGATFNSAALPQLGLEARYDYVVYPGTLGYVARHRALHLDFSVFI